MSSIAYVFPAVAERVFHCLSEDFGKVQFVQLGAHRGHDKDIVYRYVMKDAWEGVFLEAASENFEKLQGDYRGIQNLKFFRCAMCDFDGEVTFYSIRNANHVHPLASQVGSLSRDRVLRFIGQHIPARLNEADTLILSERITARRLDTLLKNQNLKPNLIHSDIQGADLKVVQSLDLSEYTPEVIIFEHGGSDALALEACLKHLRRFDYWYIKGVNDVVALSQPYWLKRGQELLEWANDAWLNVEYKARQIFPYEAVLANFQAGGKFETKMNAKGVFTYNRIKD